MVTQIREVVYNHWTGLVDWTGGLDWWTGLVDWWTGLKIMSMLVNENSPAVTIRWTGLLDSRKMPP